MKNKITDLRDHLFMTLEALRDKENPLELDRARAIADVSQVIVNSARVEVDFLRAVDATKHTNFMTPDTPVLADLGSDLARTVHRLK